MSIDADKGGTRSLLIAAAEIGTVGTGSGAVLIEVVVRVRALTTVVGAAGWIPCGIISISMAIAVVVRRFREKGGFFPGLNLPSMDERRTALSSVVGG
jgi:hypothetical protein